MARQYDVQGTKSYLIAAVFMLLIGVWHVLDGWFPRPSVMDIHPRMITLQAPAAAVVKEITVTVQQEVPEAAPLIRLLAADEPAGEIALDMKTELHPKSKVHSGEVMEILVAEKDQVAAGQPLMVLKATRDSYYLYNKTTAVIMLLGALICGIIHWAVR
ncbi:MAG: hypothetical protein PHP44_05760 [Kiritimatiellae bacterium]|nr:hypothetical protein [Kiritimatiellia bacterium]